MRLVRFIIITRNRADVLMDNLQRLPALVGLADDAWDAVIIDNASQDDTAQRVQIFARTDPRFALVQQPRNLGSVARNAGMLGSDAQLLVFLDDDSRPRLGTVQHALQRFEREPTLGMLGGPSYLPQPGGGEDGTALPLVPPACGMVVRRSAFAQVHGFDPDFFRQAEETDLAFRMVKHGWTLARDHRVAFDHDKTPIARDIGAILRLDLRNNLLLASRHLPAWLRRPMRSDWLKRYALLMQHTGVAHEVGPAITEARTLLASRPRTQSLTDPQAEAMWGASHQRAAVQRFAQENAAKRIIIADYTKTLWLTWQACRHAGLEVLAIADDNPAYTGRTYRGVPVLPDAEAFAWDAPVVLSQLNPAYVKRRAQALRQQTNGRDVLQFAN